MIIWRGRIPSMKNCSPCMALREAGERHHENAGGSRKRYLRWLRHTMQVQERHYETVGKDFEQAHESYRKYHPPFVVE